MFYCKGIQLPDPFTNLQDWLGEQNGMSFWPCIMLSDVTEYLLTRDDREIGKRLLSDYKV